MKIKFKKKIHYFPEYNSSIPIHGALEKFSLTYKETNFNISNMVKLNSRIQETSNEDSNIEFQSNLKLQTICVLCGR